MWETGGAEVSEWVKRRKRTVKLTNGPNLLQLWCLSAKIDTGAIRAVMQPAS